MSDESISRLLDRMEILDAREWLRLWPLALVVIGLGGLIRSRGSSDRVWGGILVAAGVLFQLNQFGDIRFHVFDAWPLLIIACGLLPIWTAIEQSRVAEAAAGAPLPVLKQWVVFGGVELTVTTQNFQGGQVQALFGGCEIDLSKASMEGNQITIQANALFGGVELRVPESWDVTLHSRPIFGGYEDNTRHPKVDGAENVKRLVVEGFAIFGGVEIKN